TTTSSFDYLDNIICKITETLNFDAGAIYLFNREDNTLNLSASKGIDKKYLPELQKVRADNSPLGGIFINGVAKIIRNIDVNDKKIPPSIKAMGFKSVGIFPLGTEKERIGILVLSRKSQENWGNNIIQLAVSIANSLSVAINNTKLINKLKRQANELTAVNEIAKSINTAFNLEDIINITAKKISRLIPYDKGAIVIVDEKQEKDTLHYVITPQGIEMIKEVNLKSEFAEKWGNLNSVYKRNKGEEKKVDFEWEKKIGKMFGAKSVIASPLISNNTMLGVMCLMHQSDKIYNDQDINLFKTICEEVSIAIQKSNLFKQLESSYREWENTFNSIADPIAITNNNNVVRANKAFIKKFGINEKIDLIPSILTNNLQDKKIKAKGFYYNVSSYPIIEEDKKDKKYVFILKDITAQECLERSLKESEEKYRNLFENAYDGLIIINPSNGSIIDSNRSFNVLYGSQKEEITGLKLYDIIEEISEGEKSTLSSAIKNKSTYVCEMYLKTKKDEKKIVEISTASFRFGNLDTAIAVVRDITEKKEIQGLVMQTEKMTTLGEMISGVAHELNNPLTGIMGYSELLCEENLPDEISTKLKKINKEAVQCRKIVQNLLTFARKRKPERKLIDINEIITETIDFKSYDLRTSGIEIETEFSNKKCTINADPYQIKQVILNIINNAQHAVMEKETNDSRRIKIATKTNGNMTNIKIEDNGCGIPKKNLKKIFNPFFTTKEPGKGTGLGLSVCYGIIKEHNGEISVESVEGRGTTFTISFPLANETSLHCENCTAGNSDTSFKNIDGKSKILIIDDDEIVASVMSEILKREGHFVERSSNGNDGIKKILKDDFDAVICDIKMPVMDGKKVYSFLAKNKPDIIDKFLIVTGDTFNSETANFLSKNKIPTIEKPFEKKTLIEKVNDILNNKNNPSPDIQAA
ncbi:MAG: PAS domain S-box protein, partial [Candidatus Schekmanbacteria bacterium]